ncbi:carboxyl-terminal processing protease [Abyssogena phaseoliformis symbiont OG214]|uniref:S41 family peptidase n=1 Tax=Abyssogena phaseoliformis symbiont TaxID=596095 RepID=UPI001916AC71|nr:S41 family peptidase [Abyssogena phaseoliformis symbiont]MBW5289357.1 Carboxyl-terminal protease [Candidatus Ruthia sp. Apha_13_S6]BBB22618.1 carboxyl-terminal processing protease [Abyssogena phaseoliformis symbiont OG214]
MTFLNFFKYSLFLTLFYTLFGIYTPALAKSDAEKQKIEAFFKDLEMFTAVFSNIKQLYVDDVDNKKLFNHAIKGMVSGLDPHSGYLEPKEQKNLLESASGKFGGLGIVIGMKDEAIQVISPIDDTPAYRAGIQAGDLIVKIGDKPVRGMALEDGVELMRGKAGTDIQITIVRKNKKPFIVNITREIITIISVKGYLLEKNIGYIRISSFQNPTAKLLKQTFNDLVEENNAQLSSLILDLRNNPGGVLNGAVDVSNLFLDKKGLVVYTKGRIPSSNLKFKTKSNDIMQGLPIVVLINEGSASASEIVAGALQDHKRAIIMGSTSFGKGSVQTILELQKGYGLKLTTARYYTPNGRSIQAKGIVPDIELKNISLENEAEKSVIETKEKDLDGHLEIEDPSKLSSKEILSAQEKNKTKQNKTTIEKLKKDYFVHEATNLLKALTVLNSQ